MEKGNLTKLITPFPRLSFALFLQFVSVKLLSMMEVEGANSQMTE